MGCGSSVQDARRSSQASKPGSHKAATVISPGVSQSQSTMGRKSKTEFNIDGPRASYGIITLVPPIDLDNRSNSNATSMSVSKETDPFALNSTSQRPSEFSNSIAGTGPSANSPGPEFGLFTGSCFAVFGPNKEVYLKNYAGGFMHPELKDIYMPTARERRRAKLTFFSEGPPPASTGFPFNARGLLLLHPQRELEPLPLAAFQPIRISSRDASDLEWHIRSLEGTLLTHERYLTGSEDASRLLSSSCIKLNPILLALMRHLSIRARDLAVLLQNPEIILKGIEMYDVEKSRAAHRRRCTVKRTDEVPTATAGTVEGKPDDAGDSMLPHGSPAVDDSFEEPEELMKWTDVSGEKQQEDGEKEEEECREKWLEFLKQEIILDLHYTLQVLRSVVASNTA